jgi:hypothetical protein
MLSVGLREPTNPFVELGFQAIGTSYPEHFLLLVALLTSV